MEGLEAVEIPLSTIGLDNRFDSEYYRKCFLTIESQINIFPHQTIGSFSKVTDGEHGSVEYIKNGVKYLTAENIKNGFVDISNVRYVNEAVHHRNRRAEVKIGNILLSIKGTLGEVAVATKELPPANMNRDIAIIKNNSAKYNNEFLALFLMSSFGKKQSVRLGSGGVQQMITLERLRKISIPLLCRELQDSVSVLYQTALLKLEQSKSLYKEAEETLLSALELNNYSPTEENISIKSLSKSFGESGRLDSEFYQPKYDELLDIIKKNSQYFKKIGEFSSYNSRGLQPVYVENGDLMVITSKHILETGLAYGNFEKTSSTNWTLQAKARIFTDDILTYTTGANIGRTATYTSNKKALASNHVNILRIVGEKPVYVGFVLNSIVGRLQTEKRSAGSAQAELYPKDINEFLIPFIPDAKQDDIIHFLTSSRKSEYESKQHLDLAKKAVEIAIEESEEAAIRLIENIV